MSNNPMRPVRKPPPFTRPSIDLDKHGREWRTVRTETLEAGDVVKDKGLIKYRDTSPISLTVKLMFVNGEVEFLEPDVEVEAFVRRSDEG